MGVSTMWVYILTLPASQVRFSKWAKCVTSVPVECTPRPSEVSFGVRIGGFMLCAVRRRGSQLLCGSWCGDLVIGLITCDKLDCYPKSAPHMGVSTMWAYILTEFSSKIPLELLWFIRPRRLKPGKAQEYRRCRVGPRMNAYGICTYERLAEV